MASSSLSLTIEEGESRNWADLPRELTSSIFYRLGVIEILKNAQKVCKSWRRVCKDPSMWRKIDIGGLQKTSFLEGNSLYRQAVDLSQGGLLEINFSHFCSDDLLTYTAHRSSNLRSLTLHIWFQMASEGLANAITKLPLLETLEIPFSVRIVNLKAIGHSCPQLQTLKLNSSGYWYMRKCDDNALAIAESMPQLRHLQLIGNRLSDTGLNAILDNLHHLKHLDLRRCFHINFVGNLEKRCLERVKELRRPCDSIADCPFDMITFINSDFDDDMDNILGR